MNNEEKISPFTPGSPVPIELFIGRQDKIQEIVKYVQQASKGKQENVFLVGDRGIGKSSLASFIRHYVTTQCNMVGIHAFLGGVTTLEETVHHIFDQLLKESQAQPWYEKITQLFSKHIRQVGVLNISVAFSPPEEDLRELVRNFPAALNGVIERLEGEKSGLFIVLDDIDSLVEKVEFANWYKSVTDEIATHFVKFPVFIMLVGYPEKRDILYNLQPSLMRVFRVEEIERLSDEEVSTFLYHAFQKADVKVEDEAMKHMVDFSSGLPIMMHEIGDAVFWKDTDGLINNDDVFGGLIKAAENVGQKYLIPKVYRAILSPRYRAILRKFGKRKVAISRYFKKSELEADLKADEKRVLNNFLRKMRELGVIERDLESGSGAYKFLNDIYPVYIWLESRKS